VPPFIYVHGSAFTHEEIIHALIISVMACYTHIFCFNALQYSHHEITSSASTDTTKSSARTHTHTHTYLYDRHPLSYCNVQWNCAIAATVLYPPSNDADRTYLRCCPGQGVDPNSSHEGAREGWGLNSVTCTDTKNSDAVPTGITMQQLYCNAFSTIMSVGYYGLLGLYIW
jgi:hypothetical protein